MISNKSRRAATADVLTVDHFLSFFPIQLSRGNSVLPTFFLIDQEG
jgi:hypothetical protein